MANLETIGNTNLGNTKTKLVRVVPSKFWCLTWNNYPKDALETLETKFHDSKYILGLEVGENGTPHVQGYVEFPEKRRPIEYVKIKEIHWEKAKGSTEDNIKYCSKDNNFITNFKIKKPLKKLACEDNLYKWEQDIINIIKNEPDDRTIHWYWEAKGCSGKTTFCKYLTRKFNAICLEGKKNDILYCAAEFESEIYIYDIERSLEEFVSYGAIEKIKNGYYMCAKYESKPIDRNPPHVIIFANFPPDIEKLSVDRWHIVEINNTQSSPLMG